jgi:pimeloyl-ACP methyl ester carboxylesterase
MSPTKPSIVIIPGSFSPDSFYFETVDKLREYGYETIVKNLPSASRAPPEKAATMSEDADYFRAVVEKLADEGKDVVLVTHSYGGVVGTEAARDVLKTERQAAGKPGGVVRLVYVTSVVPTPGNSLRSLMGDLVPSFIEVEVSL